MAEVSFTAIDRVARILWSPMIFLRIALPLLASIALLLSAGTLSAQDKMIQHPGGKLLYQSRELWLTGEHHDAANKMIAAMALTPDHIDISDWLTQKNKTTLESLTHPLIVDLKRRLERARRYIPYRASETSFPDKARYRFRTARTITLSKSAPDLIWNRVGPLTRYELVVDDALYSIPPKTDIGWLRYTIQPLAPGEHHFRIGLFNGEQPVPYPRHDNHIIWLDDKVDNELFGQLTSLEEQFPDNPLLAAVFLDTHGLLVPAFERYRKLWVDDPLNPVLLQFLIRVSKLLGLECSFSFYKMLWHQSQHE
ncbi:MAG: hypothetical protein HQL54_03960 [Magnetococcales bacterium]|nr:hypothetical protein [Magnetococcales bacterium]